MFRAAGVSFDVEHFLSLHGNLPIHSVWRCGEPKQIGKAPTWPWSGFSLVASESGMDEFDQQITDVIRFIREHAFWLQEIGANSSVESARFDFGVEISFSEMIPELHFPAVLIKAAGKVGVSLQISLYRVFPEAEG